MQRLPHLGAGHTHSIIIVNSSGLPHHPGTLAPGTAGIHQQQSSAFEVSSSHQHPDLTIRTGFLHYDPRQQVRRSLPIRQSNRPMVTSVLHYHTLPATAQGPLLQPVGYLYDLEEMNRVDQPISRVEVPLYSSPVPFTLQNMTAQNPQTPDVHFSPYVLLLPHEECIHFQQPHAAPYEDSQTLYTTLPIQVQNVVYTPRPSTSSSSQPNQPQTSMPPQGSANTHCASLKNVQKYDCKQKQQWESKEVQIIQGFQPEASKQQRHNIVSMQYDSDTAPETKALASDTTTDAVLNSMPCTGNQLQEGGKPHRAGLYPAQSSSQEIKAGCEKRDRIQPVDQKKEYKKLMMLTFEDAVMMFDFELFDSLKLNGQITEQDQGFLMQNKVRKENNQKIVSKRTHEDQLSKEGKSGLSDVEAEHGPGIKLTLSSLGAETSSIPHGFTSDHSFYDLKPEQVNLQTLLELEDISADESCWESLSHKDQTQEQHRSPGVDILPVPGSATNRKRKNQFQDLESQGTEIEQEQFAGLLH
ncbi:uncharacterized protein LOC132392120 [Hypanus sabinus]|uniref:uncharacterized protein LOC132392120 n=1 Tax=Hypanus sabinus TaxID=79690 RepID=UPI0028C37CDE|nr:uncharacterized protein LOC132392120 [Hypanus sabinus]